MGARNNLKQKKKPNELSKKYGIGQPVIVRKRYVTYEDGEIVKYGDIVKRKNSEERFKVLFCKTENRPGAYSEFSNGTGCWMPKFEDAWQCDDFWTLPNFFIGSNDKFIKP